MSQNYFLEFRYIPSIIDRCKKGILPFNALTDIELWKKELEQFDCEINWDELTIEILDELGIAENLRLGTGHKIGEYYPNFHPHQGTLPLFEVDGISVGRFL